MKKTVFGKVEVEFELNAPLAENGNVSEDFEYETKGGFVTQGVQEYVAEILESKGSDKKFAPAVMATVFETIRENAQHGELDYLQKLTIEGKQVWVIDNGDYITAMFPDEY